MKARVHYYNGKEIKYFKCRCGGEHFKVRDEMYDDIGVIEYEFGCKCGKRYNFSYGNIEEQK